MSDGEEDSGPYIPDFDRFQDLVSREPEDNYSVEQRPLDDISRVFKALDKPEKIIVFYEACQRNSLTQVEEVVNVSSSTIYNYVDDLEDSGLIRKKTQSGRKYEPTKLGDYVYRMMVQLDLMLVLMQREKIRGESLEDDTIYNEIKEFRYVGGGLRDEDSS